MQITGSAKTATALPACTRCGELVAAPYPVLIVGQPYHADCAAAEEADRLGFAVCDRPDCRAIVPPTEALVVDDGDGYGYGVYCIDCKERHYPHEDATLMSVVIAEQ